MFSKMPNRIYWLCVYTRGFIRTELIADLSQFIPSDFFFEVGFSTDIHNFTANSRPCHPEIEYVQLSLYVYC